MKRYIPLKLFSKFESNEGDIEWTGKNGIVGVVPVFNSLVMLKRKYPNDNFVEIEII